MTTLSDRFDFRQIARWGGDSILNAIFPHRCLSCDRLYNPESGIIQSTDTNKTEAADTAGQEWNHRLSEVMGSHVCSACLPGLLPVQHPICTQCGKALQDGSESDHLCGDCIQAVRPYRKARALCIYDRTGLALIHALKYRGKIQLAGSLGALLLQTYLHYWQNDAIDVIVPVPLHRKRFRERGFNQAYLLVSKWPKQSAAITIDRHALIRRQIGKSQTGLNRRERIANVRHAFAVASPEAIVGRRLLLIDDVYTTGATADACARTLLESGAAIVDVLTLARAV